MSAQQQYLQKFTSDDYDRLINEAKFAVSSSLLASLCKFGSYHDF